MGLLDQEIRTIVDSAISGLLLDATFHSVTLSADGMGGFTESESDSACKAFVDSYSDFTMANGGAQIGDYKVTITQLSLTPTPKVGDRVTIDGQKLKIVEIAEDPASAIWECKSRLADG